MPDYHLPVMAEEVVKDLVTDPDGTYLDATAGGGGHVALILSAISEKGRVIATDRDADAIMHCQSRFGGEKRLSLHQMRFSRLQEILPENGIQGALFDLGVSSHQLDAADRGFSFRPRSSLDMRMDRNDEVTAIQWMEESGEEELARAFRYNADLNHSKKLSRMVFQEMDRSKDADTFSRAVDKLYRTGQKEKNKILARMFQAVRMEINEELNEIETGLKTAVKHLNPQGRIVVLSYHSVEDRKVKRVFAGYQNDCICPPGLPVCACGGNNRKLLKLHSKPLIPGKPEITKNPRSRSAKMRVCVRTGGKI